ncbi:MAG: hypothetical protein J5685_01860 [Clostridiales bacterium]|nr:hypothetical protein [Clostridiales bacterium]
MKRFVCNLIIGILTILLAVILIGGNIWTRSVPVATVRGSYAEQYAQDNHLQLLDIPDSLNSDLDIQYEEFTYNISENGIIIEGYNGVGNNVVVPHTINGITVVALGTDFFINSDSITDLYLPLSVYAVEASHDDNCELYLNSHSPLIDALSDADWNINVMADSEYAKVNYELGEIPFLYNYDNGGIELTAYTGSDSIVVIPSHINGYPVTTVSFEMCSYSGVVFSNTVNQITGKTRQYYMVPIVVLEIIACGIATVAAAIAINIFIPRRNKTADILLLSQSSVTLGYVIIQFAVALCVLFAVKNLNLWVGMIINLIIFVMFIISIILLSGSRKHIEHTVEKQTGLSQSVKEIKSICRGINLDFINDSDLKKKATSVIDDIKYLAPSNTREVADIDSKISRALLSLSSENNDEPKVRNIIDELDLLIKQRKSHSIR